MTNASQVTNEALSLPLNDRVRLAQELWASLHPPRDGEADEASPISKAKERDQEIANGEVEGVQHREALAQARKSLE